MKFSDMVRSYTSNPKLKGELLEDIEVGSNPGEQQIRRGTVSEILIHKGGDSYHFEAQGIAITVARHEFKII